jgi:hypothetical protein
VFIFSINESFKTNVIQCSIYHTNFLRFPDRLLGFADQFIENMENDENYDIDSDERESIDDYRRIRPLLAAAPRMLDVLQSVEVLIRLELEVEPGTSFHGALRYIQSIGSVLHLYKE